MEICKHNDSCGGCIYQELPYEEQVELKLKDVKRLLTEREIVVDDFLGIVGSPQIYGYRNKMEYTFGDEVIQGPMTLGMHKRGRFMSIITVDQCQLVHEDFNRVLRGTLDFAQEQGYEFYHKKTHKGLLRNLIIRRGVRSNELLINLVTSSQVNLDQEAFISMIESLPLKHTVVGILQTINDGLADAVNCDELRILKGRDYYNEDILGLHFQVSAFSFFQTNIEAIERLYSEALSMIENVEGKTVFDLYCGTGTITQTVAMSAKEAIGVEIVEDAVESAKINAKKNQLDNCMFIAGDVLKVLDDISKKPDVIIVDPPRAGIHHKAMGKILDYGVSQILYISCNPKTMMENLQAAQFAGYQVTKMKVYDNFAFTKHSEAVTLLTKVN